MHAGILHEAELRHLGVRGQRAGGADAGAGDAERAAADLHARFAEGGEGGHGDEALALARAIGQRARGLAQDFAAGPHRQMR